MGCLSGEVCQAVGCSGQKLGQEVEAEDKVTGNVYMEGEILKVREGVCEKSSKLRIGPEENPEESLRCGRRTQSLQGTSPLVNKVSFFKGSNSSERESEYVIPTRAFSINLFKRNLRK